MKTENRLKVFISASIFVLLIYYLMGYYQHSGIFISSNLDIDYLEKNINSLDQSDPRLIKYTRIRYMTPPSDLPYKLMTNGRGDTFSPLVLEIFNNKTDGIFIEAGAHDGDAGSHTLYLEKAYNWRGLLVECNSELIPELRSRHRKAWIASVCLAPGAHPGILNFSTPANWTYSGRFGKTWNIERVLGGKPRKWTQTEVQTIPLFTILAAIGFTEIDYFSFDIEGSELGVLRGFPFDKVIFKVLIIEIYFYTEKEKKEMDDLLLENNYHFAGKHEIDHVYVHNSVKDKLNLKRFS